MNQISTSLDDIQQATPQMLVGSILLIVGTAVAISLAIYLALRLALVLDGRKGGQR